MGNCCVIPVSKNPTCAVENEVDKVKEEGRMEQQQQGEGEGEGGGGGSGLKMFSLEELKSATGDYQAESVVGEGGFGRVYKGYIHHGHGGITIPVAVKKCNPFGEQGLKEWKAEVKFLGSLRHPNLVKLLGYCWEDKQLLLVYEFVQNGSLENHLFRDIKGAAESNATIIPWETRIKIALEAGIGLAFLHSTSTGDDEKVIYRDFKASNILLDQDFNAKISDFGLAKLGPALGQSHVSTQIVGTYGYAAPEYVATGHLYVKSDVYSFGVVLLELITGLRVHDLSRPSAQVNLVEWTRPLLPHKQNLHSLMDPNLGGQYPSKAAYKMAHLILKCLQPNPKSRPGMQQVLHNLHEIRCIKIKPKKSRSKLNQD